MRSWRSLDVYGLCVHTPIIVFILTDEFFFRSNLVIFVSAKIINFGLSTSYSSEK